MFTKPVWDVDQQSEHWQPHPQSKLNCKHNSDVRWHKLYDTLISCIFPARLQKSKQIQKHKHKHIITHSWLSTSNHFHSWLMIVWVAAGRLPINPLIHRTWQDRQINGFICRLYLTNNIQAANWMSSLIQIQLPSNQLVANPATPPSLSQKRGVDSQRQRLASRSDTSTITPINCLPELQNVTSMSQVWHKYVTLSRVWQICLCSNIGRSTITPINCLLQRVTWLPLDRSQSLF